MSKNPMLRKHRCWRSYFLYKIVAKSRSIKRIWPMEFKNVIENTKMDWKRIFIKKKLIFNAWSRKLSRKCSAPKMRTLKIWAHLEIENVQKQKLCAIKMHFKFGWMKAVPKRIQQFPSEIGIWRKIANKLAELMEKRK